MNHFEQFESYIPVDLSRPFYFFAAVGVIFLFIIFRYFLMAGLFWFIFYSWRPESVRGRQIYKELPDMSLQKFEIKWSLMTSFIFAISGVILGLIWQLGWTQIYLKMDQYGWIYFFGSLVIMSLVHEVYFYWTHRALHHPKLFRSFHSVHHRSLTPSPWASFSFHPVEGLIQAVAIPLMVLFIPVHPVALLIYLTFMSLSAVSNHLGFELLPAGGEKGIGRWLISGVHHTMHHKYYRSNYGLFYTFCDLLFKTEHPAFAIEYQSVFESTFEKKGAV